MTHGSVRRAQIQADQVPTNCGTRDYRARRPPMLGPARARPAAANALTDAERAQVLRC